MRLRYRSDFHPDLGNLSKRLRCLLGGDRPSQTTHQALSPHQTLRFGAGHALRLASFRGGGIVSGTVCAKRSVWCRVRGNILAEWYSILRLHPDRNRDFKVSHLFSATKTLHQYQAIVKLHGVFSSCCRTTASLPSLQFHRDLR